MRYRFYGRLLGVSIVARLFGAQLLVMHIRVRTAAVALRLLDEVTTTRPMSRS